MAPVLSTTGGFATHGLKHHPMVKKFHTIFQNNQQDELTDAVHLHCARGSKQIASLKWRCFMTRVFRFRRIYKDREDVMLSFEVFEDNLERRDEMNRNSKNPGCDCDHWYVIVEQPKCYPVPYLSKDEIIHSYVKTLALVIGSENEDLFYQDYYAFGVSISEKTSHKLENCLMFLWFVQITTMMWRMSLMGSPHVNGQTAQYDVTALSGATRSSRGASLEWRHFMTCIILFKRIYRDGEDMMHTFEIFKNNLKRKDQMNWENIKTNSSNDPLSTVASDSLVSLMFPARIIKAE